MKRTIVFLILILASNSAYAGRRSQAAGTSPQPEKADVGAIKEKYWAKGDESELGVVQNRLYSKSGKLEIGGFGGLTSSDPFLDVKQLGGSIGYHFSELWAVHLFGWKS